MILKNILVPFFVFQLAILLSPLIELYKIPILLHHYEEHKNSDQSISFIKFISIHYLGGQHIEHHEEKDQSLPFKSIVHTSNILLAINISSIHLISNSQMFIFTELLNSINTRSFFPQQYFNFIWQPPKF